jgi:hypothetical protein
MEYNGENLNVAGRYEIIHSVITCISPCSHTYPKAEVGEGRDIVLLILKRGLKDV